MFEEIMHMFGENWFAGHSFGVAQFCVEVESKTYFG